MARKKDTPQKAALRELMSSYMKENNVKIKDGADVNSIMRDMMSVILEGALDEELDEELGYSKYDYRNKETDNSRNGHSHKTMHTSYGDMDLEIPRDRKGEFEPQLIKKYQNTVTQDMEEKIISMYAKGMTTGDIESHMRELYDIDISDSTISRITDKILPIVKEWQERPLEEIYAVVFMDAIHYHVRHEGRIVKRAVYIAIGIDMDGHKDVLGMYVGQNESAKFWLSILNGLKNRGVQDILIACVDGLSGFPQAIEAVYPETEVQQCIIHQIRNTTRFVVNGKYFSINYGKKFTTYKRLIPDMLQDLRDNRSGSPGDLGDNYTNEEGILVNDTCHAEWDKILDKMIFLWRESREETCSRKNPFEEEYDKAFAKFHKEYGFWGEELQSEAELEENKKRGVRTVHYMDELPEYKEIYDLYYAEERKMEEYREQCRDEALDMLKEYFMSLWD